MPTYARNKKALYNYSIEDQIEAGLVLAGHEVKSIRGGQVSLEGAYVTIRAGEAYLRNAYVGKYKQASNLDGYDEQRERKLLLNKNEIIRLTDQTKGKGLTLIPLEIYTSKKRLKLKVGVAKGKKQFDKRETIKRKEAKRKVDRVMKTEV
ncbi:MAG: SsrA-binding protein [Candidatus Doudnabacteria bacterium RIFCSPLOWO2_01_FULL_44_21]|uniref:SsrA-binding protein n=1 Tax=Candidatus Doudnabacteria bacterium RIFCSPLOWO2_01_FULL_44_21 TaxID=1817841 RepID=A0A1F5Q594_9BACT|nr:MAG: SsrA-binding protein [Candidatus Doudnabacteria bacterium RIFCSPHIGHO2_02_FULL_43_13b]OGE97297.1 MAG: SsrA-binding protein [Candidatus Doudnabacteria bacterium RIFCSPLOWO2_01_FULL_44_21]